MFKKGDYIVIINKPLDSSSGKDTGVKYSSDFKRNYCFKQKEDSSMIEPEVDCSGSTTNGWACYKFTFKNWRYATDLEAAEYERLGKPFDITTLKPKFEVGDWYKLGDWVCKFERFKNKKIWHSFAVTPHDGYVFPNSGYLDMEDCDNGPEKITDISHIQKYLPDGHVDKIKTELTIGDLVEGEIYVQNDYYIFKHESRKAIDIKNSLYHRGWSDNSFHGKWGNLKKASFSERQWLNACIKAYKFIPKDEALNSDFVLPEKWCVKVTIESSEDINEWKKTTENSSFAKNNDYVCDNGAFDNGIGEDEILITFDQFKKYVLKDEVVEPKKSEFELKVNSWYNISKIYDQKHIALVFYQGEGKKNYGFNHSGEWGNVYSSDWTTGPNSTKSRATLASQEEIEARLIEYAKKKYPVGTKFKNKDGKVQTISHSNHSFNSKYKMVTSGGCPREEWDYGYSNAAIFHENKWVEIIKEEVKLSDVDVDFDEVKPVFNRDFYVKVNSQEEADAMFDYLKSQGEVVVSNIKYDGNKLIQYNDSNGDNKDCWYLGHSNIKNVIKRPLSDFITIPASTNDSDPLGIIGKKFKTNTLYQFYKYKDERYWLNWEGDEIGASYQDYIVEDNLNNGLWKIIEDEISIPQVDFYVGNAESWGTIGHQNQLGMIRKNIIPEPKASEVKSVIKQKKVRGILAKVKY